MSRRIRSQLIGLTATVTSALTLGTAAMAEPEVDLTSFDLEDLMSMEVTSVSKKSERAFEAPAAAFVITSEDIRRSGARTIPELLRLVPGVQVAQLSASQHAVSVRGFNGNFSDKLLVLQDGRSIYTPLFAGVFWDVQDTPLADIDRIEVIRGPGGTVWGSNAVNGVINIVTKSAKDTQGWHVEVGIGDYERGGSGMVRYGGSAMDDKVNFRMYLKQFDRENFKSADGFEANDAYNQIRTGFRMDAEIGESGTLTLQGDLYDGKVHSTVAEEADLTTVGGGNVLGRYTHKFSDTHNASVQFYYDRTDRNVNILTYELDTFDLELKHQIAPLPWLDLVWGGEYRHRNDDSKVRNPSTDTIEDLQALFTAFGQGDVEILGIHPEGRKWDLFSGFVQAEGRALDDKLRLTVGTKLEQNDTSGFEVQPSARLAFIPTETMTFWASAARAVRTPSRANEDIDTLSVSQTPADDGRLTVVRNSASRSSEAEDLMAYEAGIRLQPIDRVHIDLAGFYNDYDDLIVTETNEGSPTFGPQPLPPPTNMFTLVDTTASNSAKGEAWGFELFTRVEVLNDYEIFNKWWIDMTYAYIDVDIDRKGNRGINSVLNGALGKDGAAASGQTESHHTVGMRSHMNFICDIEFDLAYYYASKVSSVGGNKVDSYHRVDLRTAWRPTEHVEASFIVENVFEGEHQEWNTELFIQGTKVPRMFYGKITLDF